MQKTLRVLSFLLLTSSTLIADAYSAPEAAQPDWQNTLHPYIGKYPSENIPNGVEFRKNLLIAKAIRLALTAQYYQNFTKMQVETPIEVIGANIATSVCVPHDCGANKLFLLIDRQTGHVRGCLIGGVGKRATAKQDLKFETGARPMLVDAGTCNQTTPD